MHVLTFASGPRPGLSRLLQSCDQAGLHPLVLGYGAAWRGFGYRLRTVAAAVAALRGPVLFLDAFDVVVTERAAELERRWRSAGHPLWLNAETNCWPHPDRWADYPEANSRYRFLNAGAWIGEAEYVTALLRGAGVERLADGANDQEFWTELHLRNPQACPLDTGCVLFQTLWEAQQDLERVNGVWRNRVTGTAPAIFHGNGGVSMEFLNE